MYPCCCILLMSRADFSLRAISVSEHYSKAFDHMEYKRLMILNFPLWSDGNKFGEGTKFGMDNSFGNENQFQV